MIKIRKGYEEAMPTFIAGNVEEQIEALFDYTKDLKEPQPPATALVGADIIDVGLLPNEGEDSFSILPLFLILNN